MKYIKTHEVMMTVEKKTAIGHFWKLLEHYPIILKISNWKIEAFILTTLCINFP